MTGKTLGEVPEQELRLAVVLNGGVSLAVWMGGVAHELDRLTRSAGALDDDPAQNPYGALLWLAGARAVVDVISGTSAGGINGAALALAQVNPKADLMRLRALWSEQGRMEELLRQPFQGNPNSLLRGDDYFLPQLNSALTGLASSFEPTQSTEPRSVDLTITTTLLTGAPLMTVDDQGQELPQRLHAAHFQFCVAEDDTKTELVEKAGAMALAARCTASFPLAFEPSYVPLLARATGDSLRPDMEPYASWAVPASRRPVDYDGSRYAVDGGVLANTPTKAALDAISRRRADGPVRRTMVLVFPHAPGAGEVGPDAQDQPFTAAGTLTGVLGALQSQGSRTYVERLEEHNRRAADWRGGRRDVLETLGQDDDMAGLYGLVETAWPYYRCLRRRRAAADLAERVAPRLRRKDWPYERVRRAAETAQGAHPPYVPSQPPHLTPATSGDPDDLGWNWGFSVALGVVDAVREIFRGALEVGSADEIRTLRTVLPRIYEAIAGIEDARRAVDDDWVTDPYLTSLEPDEHYWAARLLAYRWGLDPREAAARDRAQLDQLLPSLEGLDTVREHALDRLAARDGEAGRRARAAVTSAVEALVEVRGAVLAVARTSRSDVLEAWLPLLTTQRTPPSVPGEGRADEAQASYGGEPAGGVERLLQRLLSLDVATWLVADGPATGTSLPISLLQLSLRTDHPWVRYSITPDDKAAGMELARFGGFLKRSWRMNDWAWGRLDAITMLCRAALDPRRLRSIAQLSECAADDVFGAVRKHLYGSGALPDLVSGVEEEAKGELRTVFDTAKPLPPALPNLAAFLAFPIQAAAMLEELPVLVAAIELDRVEGASRRSRGERFLVDQKPLLERVHEHQVSASAPDRDRAKSLQLGADALAAFDAAGIGREPLVDELGSDSLIRTVTKAAGAVATVLDSSESGLKAIKQITGTVRGAMLLPYWVIVGLTSASALAQFLATLGLVAGGTLLILALFGVLGGFAALGATIGAGAVLAAFSYSAFRTGSLLHASALLAPIGPLVAYALHTSESAAGEQATSAGESASRVLVLAVVVACLYGLGRLPWPVASPIVTATSALDRGWRRHPIRTIATPVVVLLLVAAGVLWWSPSWLPAWAARLRGRLAEWLEPVSDWLQSLAEAWPFEVATYALWSAALVLAGSFWSYYSGTQLRIWRPVATIGFGSPRSLTGTFRLDRVISAAGVAATWAVFYGAAYLIAAWIVWALALRGDPEDRAGWLVFTVWWCASVALVLIMLAPLVLGRRARLQARHALVASGIDLEEGDRAEPGTSRTSDVEQRTLAALMKSDMAYQAVCRSGNARRFVPLVGRQASGVALHWRGRRMLRAARKRASLTRSRASR